MILNENKWCKWLFVDCSIKCVPHFPDEIALDRRELHATRPPTSELAARPRRRILARFRVRDVAGCLDAVVVRGAIIGLSEIVEKQKLVHPFIFPI